MNTESISRFENLKNHPRKWLVTGVAGFIGSHLLESLLQLDQTVIGLDNYSTGNLSNVEQVVANVSREQWSRFQMVEGDIRDLGCCHKVVESVDAVLHQAALGSIPRSLEDPITTNAANITGTLNLMWAAKSADIKTFVYAASSSTYGDHPGLPKVESEIGKPLSPYAITKYVNELYAEIFFDSYGFAATGLRYFNVFGPRQDPNGAYAAVIPNWTAAMIRGKPVYINGDGETSRDFCFIENVVQANLLAADADENARGQVFNIAVGEKTTLNQLFEAIRDSLASFGVHYERRPVYRDFRPGDVRHSLASIEKATRELGYRPSHTLRQGLMETMAWYQKDLQAI